MVVPIHLAPLHQNDSVSELRSNVPAEIDFSVRHVLLGDFAVLSFSDHANDVLTTHSYLRIWAPLIGTSIGIVLDDSVLHGILLSRPMRIECR